MITFVRWLHKQDHRDDPIGDLARDMRDDRPNLLRYFRADKLPNPPLKNLRGYLSASRACSEAIDALIEAYREWQSEGNTYRETRTDRVRTGYLALRFACGRCAFRAIGANGIRVCNVPTC